MVIKKAPGFSNKYEEMVKAIAKAYLERLNNSTLFALKLETLDVSLQKSNRELSSGVCRKIGTRGIIQLAINEDNGDDYIAFIIAHEFAHLLFQKVTDVLCLTGRGNDGSTELSAITRISYDGSFYGMELEEQCADLLAIYIIKRMGYKSSYLLEEDLKKSAKKRGIVSQLIWVFGDALEKNEKIDNYRVENGFGLVSNSFWYYAVTFSFVEIVKLFDEVMGKGEFEQFCKRLDSKNDWNVELAEIEIDKFQRHSKVA